jgi:hypothetical protein
VDNSPQISQISSPRYAFPPLSGSSRTTAFGRTTAASTTELIADANRKFGGGEVKKTPQADVLQQQQSGSKLAQVLSPFPKCFRFLKLNVELFNFAVSGSGHASVLGPSGAQHAVEGLY